MTEGSGWITDSAPYPPARKAWVALIMLLLAYTCSFIDRQILSLVVQPIKADLAISDTQLSLLQGMSFAFFYSMLGIPFGLVADKWNRRNLIIGGLVAWSVATACCGLAGNFWQLFLGRMAVGVGEACLAPAAYSLISDSFRPQDRGRALTTYSSGVYYGAGLAFVAGGGVVAWSGEASAWFAAIGFARLPWQTVFIIVSLTGLVLAPFLLLVQEPARRERAGGNASLAVGAAFLAKRGRFYLALITALSCIGIVNFSFFSWTPAIFQRRFGWLPQEIGPVFGLMLAILGPIGTAVGGVIVDKVRSIPSDRVAVWVSVASSGLALPCALLAGFSPSPALALIGLAGIVFLISMPVSMGPYIVQTTTPNEFRGVAISIYLLILNVIGLGLGPLFTALISDKILKNEQMLGQSVAILSALMLPTAVCFFLLAGRVLARRDRGMVKDAFGRVPLVAQ